MGAGSVVENSHPLLQGEALSQTLADIGSNGAPAALVQVIRWLDEMGFSEAWIGEHHTAPWEPHPSPDLLIAQALLQTKRLRIGPGGFLLPGMYVRASFSQVCSATTGQVASVEPRPISTSRQPVLPRSVTSRPLSSTSTQPRPSSVWSRPASRPTISDRRRPPA